MSVDYDVDLLDELYDVERGFGIAAKFVSRDGQPADLVVIDKTSGVDQGANGMVLQGAQPAACVRVSELEVNGLDRDKMRKGHLTFKGEVWSVESTKPKPKPGSKGELMLFLQERSDG